MRIATRVRLLGPALVLATAVPISAVVYWGYSSLLLTQQNNLLLAETESSAQRLALALGQATDDLFLLAGLSEIDAFIMNLDNPDSPDTIEAREQVASAFRSTIETRPHYSQVRLIGNNGQELIRVDGAAGTAIRISQAELQDKAQRDYFQEAIGLPESTMYVSRVSLNREDGAIEVPHQPMLRIALPLDSVANRRAGILIINIRFDFLVLRSFENLQLYELTVANHEGDYLVHPDNSLTFGFDLGARHRIQDHYPELTDLSQLADRLEAGIATHAEDNSPLGFARIAPFPEHPESWYLISLKPVTDRVGGAARATATNAVAVTFVLLLIGAIAAYLVASRMIRPIRDLTRAASDMTAIPEADFAGAERQDEVGDLTRALNSMLAALRANETILRESNRDLEYFARIASHDLREPARRIAALANLIQEQSGDPSAVDTHELVERIRTQSLAMVDQLTALRSFSRLSQQQMQREKVDVKELIEKVLESVEGDLKRRSVQVQFQHLPTVSAYRQLLEFLYLNLISNALHHAADDGFVLIFTCESSEEETVLGVMNSRSRITGDTTMIFEPFVSGSNQEERFGLGLSISKRIVERHGGRIQVETSDDTVHFHFTLEKNPG